MYILIIRPKHEIKNNIHVNKIVINICKYIKIYFKKLQNLNESCK